MTIIPLNSAITRHMRGSQKGSIEIEYWELHKPLDRYRVFIAEKVWDMLKGDAKHTVLWNMRVRASTAIAERALRG